MRIACHLMGYCFAPYQYAVVIEDRAILLDVAADRYRLLGAPVGAALRGMTSGGPSNPTLDRLVAQGILTTGDREIPLPPTPVERSAIERTAATVCERLSASSVATALMRSALALRTRGLRLVLENARSRAIKGAFDQDRLIALAQAYACCRSNLPLRNICLPDSLALHRILSTRGLASTLVIGVRLDPFMAHCWVQAGDMVLNDTCDHLSAYRPIFHL